MNNVLDLAPPVLRIILNFQYYLFKKTYFPYDFLYYLSFIKQFHSIFNNNLLTRYELFSQKYLNILLNIQNIYSQSASSSKYSSCHSIRTFLSSKTRTLFVKCERDFISTPTSSKFKSTGT